MDGCSQKQKNRRYRGCKFLFKIYKYNLTIRNISELSLTFYLSESNQYHWSFTQHICISKLPLLIIFNLTNTNSNNSNKVADYWTHWILFLTFLNLQKKNSILFMGTPIKLYCLFSSLTMNLWIWNYLLSFNPLSVSSLMPKLSCFYENWKLNCNLSTYYSVIGEPITIGHCFKIFCLMAWARRCVFLETML